MKSQQFKAFIAKVRAINPKAASSLNRRKILAGFPIVLV
jgi:hypothetical protein